jgi:hypothetical protein
MNSATRDIESRDTFEVILKHISDFLKDSAFQDAAKEIVCSVLEGKLADAEITTLRNEVNLVSQEHSVNSNLLQFMFKV